MTTTLVSPTLTPSYLDTANTWTGAVHRMSHVERMVWMSQQASALDAVDYGRECVRYAQSNDERDRRRMVQRRREFITDNWQHLLYADMKDRIREPTLWP